MAEIFYQRELNYNYMIVPFKEEEKETYERRMMLDNHIDGLLPLDVRIINGELFCYYNIHSLQSIQVLFEHKLFDKQTLVQLLCGIAKVFRELGKYLLSPENLYLSPECVYMNIETGEVFLCFLPHQKSGKETFEELAEFLINRVNHGEGGAKELAYQYYESVCMGEYDPDNLVEYVMKEETEGLEVPYTAVAYEKVEDKEKYYFAEDSRKNKEENSKHYTIQIASCMGIILLAAGCYFVLLSCPEMVSFAGWSQEDFILIGAVIMVCAVLCMVAVIRFPGNTKKLPEQEYDCPDQQCLENYLEEELETREEYMGQTTVLCMDSNYGIPKLEGMDGDEKRRFILNKNPFIIGKFPQKADGILNDSRISRVHAAIREDSGYYYISDLNSTNGTYVNGNRITGTETVRLHHLDKVCMASVEMIFLNQ